MDKPRVAITFDDGPSEWTAPILDLLAEHDQHATFFVLGCYILGHCHEVKRMALEGHEIGLHGYDHSRVDELTSAELRGQIALSTQAVHHATGLTPQYWRSPWGEASDSAADLIVATGLRIVGLGLDAYDCNRSKSDIEKAVLSQIEDGAIITLHDGVAPNGKETTKSRANTVAALPAILAACKSVTVSELLA